jgi:Predicted membrane protein (DUF2157)
MSDKQDALIEVVDLIRRHGLTLDEVSSALEGGPRYETAKSSSMLSRLFGYIGGTFVFVGLAIYVGMRWDDLSPLGRIMVTLGPGFCIFILALVCSTDTRLERAATPLFLVAALVQPAGILVMLREYSQGGDPEHGLLFMNVVMLLQQACTFVARQRTVLAFTTIVFALGFLTTALDLMDASHHVIGIVLGTSLICIAWSLDQSRHRSIAGFWYFCGGAALLIASYDWLRRTPIELLFMGLACGVIFLSTVARSRSLLFVGTVALIGYLSWYINEHFGNNLNAPLLLMLIGLVLIGLGALAVKINNAYITQRST